MHHVLDIGIEGYFRGCEISSLGAKKYTKNFDGFYFGGFLKSQIIFWVDTEIVA